MDKICKQQENDSATTTFVDYKTYYNFFRKYVSKIVKEVSKSVVWKYQITKEKDVILDT